jgi:hypothetical protein
MQIVLNTPPPRTSRSRGAAPASGRNRSSPLNQYQIIRRNGAVVPFEPNKIAVAMMKAFLAVHGTQGAASASVREVVDGLTQAVDPRAGAFASGWRHLPYRRCAGPCRARPDARWPPRDRPCLCAVPRKARAGARPQAGEQAPKAPRTACDSTAASRVVLDMDWLKA